MTHDEAMRLIDASGLQGPTHGDLPGTMEILEGRDDLVAAMNVADFRKVDELPQHAAAHCQCGDLLEYLLEKGVRLDVFMAAALGRTDALKGMLDTEPPLAHAKGAHGIALADHARNEATLKVIREAAAGGR